jgi:catechol-2,3-dioxygenase
MIETEYLGNSLSNGGQKSKYIAHYGIRTRQLKEMIDWYKNFFDAKVQFENEFAVFMTFDDEHHRLVLWTDEDTKEKPENIAGVDHIGIGLPNFGSLVAAYERLKAKDIIPFLPVNHRFTTSIYYKDPDGNEVELSVDNFPSR